MNLEQIMHVEISISIMFPIDLNNRVLFYRWKHKRNLILTSNDDRRITISFISTFCFYKSIHGGNIWLKYWNKCKSMLNYIQGKGQRNNV